MNPEIKTKWLEALRSGEYKREEGQLRKVTSKEIRHCCLGVLCDIHHKLTGEGNWHGTATDRYVTSESHSSDVVLPEKVRRWAGINDCTGVFLPDKEDIVKHDFGKCSVSLANINDNSRRTDFEDVIPFIEKYF